LILEHPGRGVNPETINSLLHPEPGGCQDFSENLWILIVEVGLFGYKGVVVELLTLFIPLPG
jgi:hypothetical protein